MDTARLEKVPLKEIWKHEANDFTPWLEENIDILGEALGISIQNPERETGAGAFSVDLLAEDESGDKIVIECQLGKTDHDHLGKILTYLTNLEAKTAIWICKEPRPEHVQTINWLNEISPSDVGFYLVRIEAVRIGDSPIAPLFSVVCSPSEEEKEKGKKKKEWAERHKKRYEFWKTLLDRSKARTRLFSSISPSRYDWIGTSAGKRGLMYIYAILKDWASVELYIDRGNKEQNKRIFDQLFNKKQEIEEAFGEPLVWERLDNRRACRIRRDYKGIGWKDEDKWEELQDKMIDAMIRLEKAFKRHIKELKI